MFNSFFLFILIFKNQCKAPNENIKFSILDGVLWSHRTTPREEMKATPFSMAYGIEAMAPAKVNVTSLCRSKMPRNVELNHDMLLDALDDIEEKRDQALLRIQNYQHQIESYYNKNVNVGTEIRTVDFRLN